jgi:hypothetical protein
MSASFTLITFQRSLSVVYRFYDEFFFPIDNRTPPVRSPLDVSIPALNWSAWPASDLSYRFSALTLTEPPPSGTNLQVQVVAELGDYVNLQPITVDLPRSVSNPPLASDFLINVPLWPTVALRPPQSETAVRGFITSSSSQPVANLKVEMWMHPAATPPPGTPFTLSDANGAFLFRFPLLKGASGSNVTINVRINNGTIAGTPSSLPIVVGQTQFVQLTRT